MTDVLDEARIALAKALRVPPDTIAGATQSIEDVAEAVSYIPELLSEVERLRATVTRVRELADKMKSEHGQSWNSIAGQRILIALAKRP